MTTRCFLSVINTKKLPMEQVKSVLKTMVLQAAAFTAIHPSIFSNSNLSDASRLAAITSPSYMVINWRGEPGPLKCISTLQLCLYGKAQRQHKLVPIIQLFTAWLISIVLLFVFHYPQLFFFFFPLNPGLICQRLTVSAVVVIGGIFLKLKCFWCRAGQD